MLDCGCLSASIFDLWATVNLLKLIGMLAVFHSGLLSKQLSEPVFRDSRNNGNYHTKTRRNANTGVWGLIWLQLFVYGKSRNQRTGNESSKKPGESSMKAGDGKSNISSEAQRESQESAFWAMWRDRHGIVSKDIAFYCFNPVFM